jgi:hypothetical protein
MCVIADGYHGTDRREAAEQSPTVPRRCSQPLPADVEKQCYPLTHRFHTRGFRSESVNTYQSIIPFDQEEVMLLSVPARHSGCKVCDERTSWTVYPEELSDRYPFGVRFRNLWLVTRRICVMKGGESEHRSLGRPGAASTEVQPGGRDERE